MFIPQRLFIIAALLYLVSWSAFAVPGKYRRVLAGIFLAMAVAFNLGSVAARYYFSWPLRPLYQGPFLIPLIFSVLGMKSLLTPKKTAHIYWALLSLLSIGALFFPKDFYLPFLKSGHITSHLFFLFGQAGQACFMLSGLKALEELAGRMKKGSGYEIWLSWGFGLWSLALFSGEVWSWLGWANPVVWDDPAIILFLATWFFYALLVHLHLTGFCGRRERAAAAVLGVVLVITANWGAELGGFRLPIWGGLK